MTGRLVSAFLVPHPPIMVPPVGGSEIQQVSNTIGAVETAMDRLKAQNPESVILISPHGPDSPEGLVVRAWDSMEGDLSQFGAGDARVKFAGDSPLAQSVVKSLRSRGLGVSQAPETRYLDHGSVVPLWFAQKAGLESRLVLISGTYGSRGELAASGQALAEAIETAGVRASILVSGDLSHRLAPGAPAGYSPRGEEFDRLLCRLVEKGRGDEIHNLPDHLVRSAGECGYRPLLMLLGAMEPSWKGRLLSYEGPFGVGYAVVEFEIGPGHGGRHYVGLARQALEHYVRRGKPFPEPERLPPDLTRQAGAFVSIKKKGQLRGCIGTVRPTQPTLAREIIKNAVSAATADPRFPPVTAEEIDDLELSVDVLSSPERVSGLNDLDPSRYGVLVEKGPRTGLLLPDLEGISTAEEQVAIACQKAGLSPEDPDLVLYRFEVERYEDGGSEADG